MTSAERFLDALRSEIGYSEDPPGTNTNMFSARLRRPPEPWCCDFLVAKADDVGLHLPEGVHGSAYTWTQLQAWQQVERSPQIPQPGDWAYFRIGAGHVGVVESVQMATVTTIDGNTIPDGMTGDQANGGMVCRKTRSRTLVAGYGRPDYSPPAQEWMTMIFKDEAEARRWFVRWTFTQELGREPSPDDLALDVAYIDTDGAEKFWTNVRDSDEAMVFRQARGW